MKKYLHIFLVVFLLWAHTALANTCAWLSGSTKNWNDATAWTACGSTFPQATDDATVSGTGTLTVNGTSGSPSLARGVDFTGFTGTLSGASTAVWNIGDPGGSGAGVFTLVSGMTDSMSSSATINFVSTTGTTNLSTGTKTMPIVVFNGVGGKWALQDNYAGTSNKLTTLTAGTLDMNGHNLTVPGGFTSATGSTRVLLMGSGTLDVGGSGTTISMGTLASGLTITAGSSTIALPFGPATINLGDQTYNTLNGSVGTSNPIQTITGNFTAASYSVTPNSSQALTLEFAGNPTFTTSFTVSAFGGGVRAFIRSSVRGTQRTITSASNTFAYTDFQDIVGAGAASWNLSAITGLSGDCGNNSGLTLTAPLTVYAKTGSTQLNFANAYWFTSSGGSTSARSPLPQDTAKFDANSITAGGVRIDIGIQRTGTIDFTGVTNTPLFNGAPELYGSLTLVSGMTIGGGSNLTYASPSNSTFTTGGKSIPWPLVIDAATGTLTTGDAATLTGSTTITGGGLVLGGNVSSTNFFFQTGGTFNTNGHTSSFSTHEFAGGTATIDNTMTATGAGSNSCLVDGGTINLGAQINAGGTIAISGGRTNNTGSSGEYKAAGPITISGGTHVLRKITAGTTLTFSGTSNVTIPGNGSASWGTGSNLTITPNSESLVIQGLPTFTGSSLSVTAPAYSYGN